MKKYIKFFFSIVIFSISLNVCATKIAPVSLKELLTDSSITAVVNIKKAELSAKQYKIIHSGKDKYYLNYEAIIIDSIKGVDAGKTIEFTSREPLLVSRDYLVFLNTSSTERLLVSQAGYGAFEKTFISFESGIKEGLRIPSNYISLPKGLPFTLGFSALNEQSSYLWAEWLPFKEWQIKYLKTQHLEK